MATRPEDSITRHREIRNRKVALLASLLPEERHRFCREFFISNLDEALGWSLKAIERSVQLIKDAMERDAHPPRLLTLHYDDTGHHVHGYACAFNGCACAEEDEKEIAAWKAELQGE